MPAHKAKKRRIDPPVKEKEDLDVSSTTAPATASATATANGTNGEMSTEPRFETLQLHAGYYPPIL
jgi:hypothetical protein